LSTSPGEPDVPFDASRARDALELVEQGALPTDDEPCVGVRPDDVGHRLDEVALSGERMQALHVEEQVSVGHAQLGARLGLRRLVVPGEGGRDRRIDHVQLAAPEPELVRPLVQPRAVEGDRRRAMVRAGEQIERDAPPAVVPDLRAVERQDDGLARATRQQDAELRQQPVAVHVHDIGASHRRRQRLPDAAGAADRAGLQQSIHQAARASRDPGDGRRWRAAPDGASLAGTPETRSVGVADPRRVRDVLDRVARLVRELPELPRQQRVGSLVGRQMRGHVEDVHHPITAQYCRRNSENVTGMAPSSPVA
jgi:hypothetical protein